MKPRPRAWTARIAKRWSSRHDMLYRVHRRRHRPRVVGEPGVCGAPPACAACLCVAPVCRAGTGRRRQAKQRGAAGRRSGHRGKGPGSWRTSCSGVVAPDPCGTGRDPSLPGREWARGATAGRSHGTSGGLPPLFFDRLSGPKRQQYFAAVRAGLDREYEPMAEMFSAVIQRVIQRTLQIHGPC